MVLSVDATAETERMVLCAYTPAMQSPGGNGGQTVGCNSDGFCRCVDPAYARAYAMSDIEVAYSATCLHMHELRDGRYSHTRQIKALVLRNTRT
eukprot:2183325-Rhodomonas_salina.5